MSLAPVLTARSSRLLSSLTIGASGPRGDYQLLQDTHGGQWYAISGTPSVEQRPVYQDGKPVYDGDKLRTYQVESVRYKTTPTPHRAPDRRSTEPKRRPSKKT